MFDQIRPRIMNCHPGYKDSQLDWVRQIPRHWQVIKFRYLSQESRRKNDDDVDREMLSLSSYTGVQLKQYEYESTKRTKDESLTYLVVEPNQLVVNPMWQMKRSIGVSYLHGIVSPGYRVYFVDLQRLVPQYLHHLMRSDNYVDEYNKHVRGATTYDRSVKKEDFEEIGVLLPPKEEQIQIANFLDHKTAQIDELIRAKERKIELLGEYRASLINQAVTKGLDPNVEMKPSGADWIGDIPKNWKVKKLKYFCSLKSGNGFSHDLQGRTELEIPFFKVSDTNSPENKVEMVHAQNTVSHQEVHSFKFTLHKPKSIVFPKIGAALLLNKRNVLDKNSCIDNNMMSVYSTQSNYRFLYYTMLDVDFERYYRAGGTVPSINESEVGDIPIACPTLSEQAQIADFLDHKTKQIDQLRSNEEGTIKLLKEYRQSLISEVVTGKIDVRGEV